MLLVKYKNYDVTNFVTKYKDRVKILTPNRNDNVKDWLIKFIEEVKTAISGSDIVLVDYIKELTMAFDALKMEYKVVYPQNISKEEYDQNKQDYDMIKLQGQKVEALVIKDDVTLEDLLQEQFNWIKIEPKEVQVVENITTVIPERKPLTFKDLVENDSIEITDADIRDMKALTNKFKMTMLLQAKTRLKTVLKFCDVLDKLYDELVNRIDTSLATTDTASLMYTADYIAKALSETNQFIMPLINNEKLQNFFIIDNSSVINISDSRVDINKREKIRKAAEIVLDNIDYFANGEYENIINPNKTIIEAEVENKNERRVDMIQQPSQYDCDNMEKGDIVFVRHVGLIYKIIRKLFFKNLNKIRVRNGWEEPVKYTEYYQEDCTLLYEYEVACVQKFENVIPCLHSKKLGSRTTKVTILPIVQVGLYNLQIALENNHIVTIPISYIHRAIETNQRLLKTFDDNRKIQEAIKFQKFKGSYFKKFVKEHNVKDWIPVYCSVCGKPVVFNFNEESIDIINNCECESLNFPLTKISYDEFALWYSNQVVTPSIIKRYNNFWFSRGDQS